MKVPRVDRSVVTPQSLMEQWLQTIAPTEDARDGKWLFGEKHELGVLAMQILDYCAKNGGWVPFWAGALPDKDDVWLQRFVRAGLLAGAGGTYLVTDLLIHWFADTLHHVQEYDERRKLTPNVVHAVFDALGLKVRGTRPCINHLYDGTLYTHREQFNLDGEKKDAREHEKGKRSN